MDDSKRYLNQSPPTAGSFRLRQCRKDDLMDEKNYLFFVKKAQWVISRKIGERWVSITQNSPFADPLDIELILKALKIAPTIQNMDRYFPERPGLGRCPTLKVMELCNVLDPTNPHVKKKRMVGV